MPSHRTVAGKPVEGLEPRKPVTVTTTDNVAESKAMTDEPYALIGQVRICGKRGGQPPRLFGSSKRTLNVLILPQSIAAIASQAGKSQEFVAIMKKAVLLLQTDPQVGVILNIERNLLTEFIATGSFGPWHIDTSFTSKFEGVVLLSVHVYADFD